MIWRDRKSEVDVLAALDRHDERRRREVPTISVLVGPLASSSHVFSHWADTRARTLVSVPLETADPEAIVVPWLDELAKNHDLSAAAVHWVAKRLNRDADALVRSLRVMTYHELGVFRATYLPIDAGTSVELVGRYLLERTVTGTRPAKRELAGELDCLLKSHGRPWLRVFRAIGELVNQDYLPIVLTSVANLSVTEFARIARMLTDLAAVQPRAGLAISVEHELFDSFVTQAPSSRAKAVLLESVVSLAGEGLRITPRAVLASVESHISTDGITVPEELEFQIEDLQSSKQSSLDDDARSAAERFLFERLGSIAETAGLFELNATLDFYFGSNRWIEVDLVARSLKLAVEVDGYHHFHDPEAFRRDRRKDMELQKQGYLVVRILAEDVVERLEEVIDTILEAVAFRRAQVSHCGATP